MHLECSWRVQPQVMVLILHNYCFRGKVSQIARCSGLIVFPPVGQTRAELTAELGRNLSRTDEPVVRVSQRLCFAIFWSGKLKMNKYVFREIVYSYSTCDKTLSHHVFPVCVCESDVTWCFSIFHCQSLSLFALAFPPSFLYFKVSSSLSSLSLTPHPISLSLSLFLLFHMASRPFLSHLCPSWALWCQPTYCHADRNKGKGPARPSSLSRSLSPPIIFLSWSIHLSFLSLCLLPFYSSSVCAF